MGGVISVYKPTTTLCGFVVYSKPPPISKSHVWNQWNGMVEWNGGMEWWNGMVEWNGGME